MGDWLAFIRENRRLMEVLGVCFVLPATLLNLTDFIVPDESSPLYGPLVVVLLAALLGMSVFGFVQINKLYRFRMEGVVKRSVMSSGYLLLPFLLFVVWFVLAVLAVLVQVVLEGYHVSLLNAGTIEAIGMGSLEVLGGLIALLLPLVHLASVRYVFGKEDIQEAFKGVFAMKRSSYAILAVLMLGNFGMLTAMFEVSDLATAVLIVLYGLVLFAYLSKAAQVAFSELKMDASIGANLSDWKAPVQAPVYGRAVVVPVVVPVEVPLPKRGEVDGGDSSRKSLLAFLGENRKLAAVLGLFFVLPAGVMELSLSVIGKTLPILFWLVFVVLVLLAAVMSVAGFVRINRIYGFREGGVLKRVFKSCGYYILQVALYNVLVLCFFLVAAVLFLLFVLISGDFNVMKDAVFLLLISGAGGVCVLIFYAAMPLFHLAQIRYIYGREYIQEAFKGVFSVRKSVYSALVGLFFVMFVLGIFVVGYPVWVSVPVVLLLGLLRFAYWAKLFQVSLWELNLGGGSGRMERTVPE